MILSHLIDKAIYLLEECEKRGIKIRLMGACAFWIHCLKFRGLFNTLERKISDIDFMTYKKHEDKIRDFLKLFYRLDERFMLYGYIANRDIFFDDEGKYTIDIFFDKLEMCHTIDFRGRLELDYPTITLADLLLEKMQIVEFEEKDAKDSIILLREHEVGEGEKEMINSNYISKLLSKDWGFYYTTVKNLKAVRDEFLPKYAIPKEDQEDVKAKIDDLLESIESESKTLGWKMRAKIGTKKKWYRDVEERFR